MKPSSTPEHAGDSAFDAGFGERDAACIGCLERSANSGTIS